MCAREQTLVKEVYNCNSLKTPLSYNAKRNPRAITCKRQLQRTRILAQTHLSQLSSSPAQLGHGQPHSGGTPCKRSCRQVAAFHQHRQAIKYPVGFIHGKAKHSWSNKLGSVWGKRYDVLSEFFHAKTLAQRMAAPMVNSLCIQSTHSWL